MKGCRPLTEEEVQATLQAFRGPQALRDRALFLLGVRSGFRISELLSLRLRDVCPRSGVSAGVAARISVARRHMKKKVEGRSVLLHPEARTALEEWIAELEQRGQAQGEGFVFRSRKSGAGGSSGALSRVQSFRLLQGAFERAGIEGSVATHSMRKTFANRVYERLGRDLLKTQKALGHKNINSTVSYLSFRQEEIDEAILGM